jgi:hypothetical protein
MAAVLGCTQSLYASQSSNQVASSLVSQSCHSHMVSLITAAGAICFTT